MEKMSTESQTAAANMGSTKEICTITKKLTGEGFPQVKPVKDVNGKMLSQRLKNWNYGAKYFLFSILQCKRKTYIRKLRIQLVQNPM